MTDATNRQHDTTIEIESSMHKADEPAKYKVRVVVRTDDNDQNFGEPKASARALFALKMTELALSSPQAWHDSDHAVAAVAYAKRLRDTAFDNAESLIISPDDLPDDLRAELDALAVTLANHWNTVLGADAADVDPAHGPASNVTTGA
jgi:flagellar biosynthesis regulator FlaF